MAVCDLPFANPHAMISMTRHSIYKYMLFLTRFTGRGLWYCFMGTMIWAALWDLNISWFLGFCMGLYVILLGIFSMIYGFRLSLKLDNVRKSILDNSSSPPKCPDGGFSKREFQDSVLDFHTAGSGGQNKFSDDEVDYIMNGLSFTPQNDGMITPDEYMYWL